MSNKQGHLFDPATKRNDPLTSYLAEDFVTKKGLRQQHLMLVAQAVKEHPGHTSHELAQFIPSLEPIQCQRRIHDAKVNGYIKVVGSRPCAVRKSKRLCEVYGPV
jgi:hypothetical protein